MSKSNLAETEEIENEEFGEQIQTIIYRVPKKDHDKMVEFSKPFTDVFKKYGVKWWGIFQLNSSENIIKFTNISETISAKSDEEVWLEIFHYNSKQHKKEVMEKMKNDKSCEEGFQQFLKLITPGSNVIIGDFNSIPGIQPIK